jgi:hypothetical protein
LKTFTSEIEFCSFHRIEHNGENGILNGCHMSEINHFKVFYYENDVVDDVG